MNQLCNEYGLDTIETGVTLGVAMEAGVIEFGDSKGAIQLIHEMGKGTPLGRTLSGGTGATGKIYGVTRVPAVKGQGYARLRASGYQRHRHHLRDHDHGRRPHCRIYHLP